MAKGFLLGNLVHKVSTKCAALGCSELDSLPQGTQNAHSSRSVEKLLEAREAQIFQLKALLDEVDQLTSEMREILSSIK